jgi:hypothetical protein
LRFERQQQLAVGLNVLGAQLRRLEAPAGVERNLVAAFRGQMELGEIPARGAWWMVAWATALAATVTLAVFLMRPHQPQRTHRVTRSRVQLAAVETPADFSVLASDLGEGEFLTMPNAEKIAPNEEVNLVRVEVPRSAMIALGFTVSEERASEPVEADVMLDTEGVARAVRFLDQ